MALHLLKYIYIHVHVGISKWALRNRLSRVCVLSYLISIRDPAPKNVWATADFKITTRISLYSLSTVYFRPKEPNKWLQLEQYGETRTI